jgi:hypothetical protein
MPWLVIEIVHHDAWCRATQQHVKHVGALSIHDAAVHGCSLKATQGVMQKQF